jgi:hypothetical protein
MCKNNKLLSLKVIIVIKLLLILFGKKKFLKCHFYLQFTQHFVEIYHQNVKKNLSRYLQIFFYVKLENSDMIKKIIFTLDFVERVFSTMKRIYKN